MQIMTLQAAIIHILNSFLLPNSVLGCKSWIKIFFKKYIWELGEKKTKMERESYFIVRQE